VDQCFLFIEALLSYSDTTHWAWLLWTPDAEISTWQNTTLTRGSNPCLWWNSNPQSH